MRGRRENALVGLARPGAIALLLQGLRRAPQDERVILIGLVEGLERRGRVAEM